MTQPSLPGFGPGREPFRPRYIADRLLFMTFPDDVAAARLARLAQRLSSEHGLIGKPLKTSRFHVSLQWFGDHAQLPQRLVEQAKAIGDRVRAAPFEATFDRVRSFKGNRKGNLPFVLTGGDGVQTLKAFYETIDAPLGRPDSLDEEDFAFTPHVTLLYDDLFVPEQEVEPISWTVRELVLVHSLVGRGRYVRLAKWPLRG